MKIGTTRPQQPGGVARPRAAGGGGAAGGAGFAAQVGGGRGAASAGGAVPAPPGAPLAALGALLAVQEAVAVGDGAGRRRRAVRRGHELLDRLDDLRLALLDGAVPAPALRRIAALLEDRAEPAGEEPHLEAVLREIEVRAAVELAKLERG